LPTEIANHIIRVKRDYIAACERFDLKEAVYLVFGLLDIANKYIDTHKPWSLSSDDAMLKEVLLSLVEILYVVVTLLSPIIPDTAKKIEQIFSGLSHTIQEGKYLLDENFLLTEHNKMIKITQIGILFERKV
jgi:methionyl-tRNA synthetase